MVKNVQVRLTLQEEAQNGMLLKKLARRFDIPETNIAFKILRKSIDAR